MNRWLFFLRYGLKGLLRGGQRIVIALLAVSFGVMSLIAMASVADAIGRTMTNDPRVQIGGDLLAMHSDGVISITEFAALQDRGLIDAYTPVSTLNFPLLRTEDSGRASFVQRVMGIDPGVYPLVGAWALLDPVDEVPADLLRETGSALITRDLAAQYNLAIGDWLRLADSDGNMLPASLLVAGILSDTPNHNGSHIYVSLMTAESLRGDASFDYVIAVTADSEAASAQLESSGWEVMRADQQTTTPGDSAAFFDFMLRGAGIMGLMVGGIGIANTMQVLLARRRDEIGILKTLGYSRRDIIILFVLEAGLLGLSGSLVGALIAVLLSRWLTALFANITTLLVVPLLDPTLLIGGVLVGVITTILFASYAIVQASQVRPTVIFRREQVVTLDWREALKALGFYALLAVPFAIVTSVVLGSIIEGIGILLIALVGLVVLGLVLGGGTWLTLRILPVFRFNLLKLARNSMRKRAFSMLFAMIALFTGVFALGFAATGIQNSLEQFEVRQKDDNGPNLVVYAMADTLVSTMSLLDEADRVHVRYETALTIAGEPVSARETAWDVEMINDGVFAPGGVYVWEYSPLATGDTIEVMLSDGSTQPLTIAGRYRNRDSQFVRAIFNPIIHTTTLTDLNVQPAGAHVFARVDPSQQDAIAAQIGAVQPDVMTLTRNDIDAQIQATFRNLFAFALALSALALLAGVMLVANVVSLALIERRYEIGVMKAVGYTRRHVLTTLILEYGLIGLIASAIGLLGVQIGIMLITASQNAAEGVLWMSPMTALIVLGVGVGLTLVTVLLAAWGPTRARPLSVLNARG